MGHIGLQAHAPSLRVRADQRRDIRNETVHSQCRGFQTVPLQERAQAVDHLRRAMVIRANIAHNCPDLVEVRRAVLQEYFCRLGIAQDRAERLTDFMRDRGG